ncbi:hypothetical protein [Microbacterium sp. CH12i]|uniref:hypothetical protein n=1 Tax=Microbacterium sp. CH12i TaxID=1479651 RepID=UPI000AEBA228|nr:hypothetical protein [Microbacterium sp. CH12i]
MGNTSVRRTQATRLLATLTTVLALVASGLVSLPSVAEAAASSCGVDINPIVCENSKPGTDPSVWDITGAGDSTIQGFATDISVNIGDSIDFKIDTDAAAYTIDVYRTGWYQGLAPARSTRSRRRRRFRRSSRSAFQTSRRSSTTAARGVSRRRGMCQRVPSLASTLRS